MSQELVDTFHIDVKVRILRYPRDDGGWMYDWSASNGDSPDEWFETAEEAEMDARRHF
jgi:hypothetical protein